MRSAIALVCLLAGCGRHGFDLGDDTGADDATVEDSNNGGNGDDGNGGDATPSLIAPSQASASVNVVGNITMTLPEPSTAGTMLVVALGSSDTANLGLPAGWTMASTIGVTGGCYAAIAYRANNPGGLTSVTFNQASLIPTVAQLTEWSGAAALDVIGTATSSTPVTTLAVQTAMPTTMPGGLAIDVFCEAVNMPMYTAETGWTNLGGASNGPASASFTTNYKLGVAAGAMIGETVTTTVGGKYAAVIATFRP